MPLSSRRHPTPAGRGRGEPPVPPVDARLVEPETRFEIIDGETLYVPPADEPHGSRHSKVSALLEAHAADGYDVASDMLTRTSKTGDMAPDASVFPSARDPRTGGRQIEELAFEVVSTESLGHAAIKARALTSRGVRRVFAVDVERRAALAWSRETNTWEILPRDGFITDPALSAPLPVRALVDASKADDAMAAALITKKNPVIEEAIVAGEGRGQKRGQLEGKITSLLLLMEARGLTLSKKEEKRVRAADDEATLDAWIRRAACAKSADDVL